ncbi:hypothetical protein NFI96_027954 [Prochilodus magdalenae]|nr:hypothetical protein NFI96_027954 [Prochilodus magdalenae]
MTVPPKLGEKGAVSSAAPAGDSQSSLPDTAVLQVGSSTHKAPGSRSVKSGSVAPSREAKSATLPMRTEPSRRPHRAPALPSEDLIHMMCRLSPPPARRDSASSPPPSLMDSLCRMDPDGPLPVIKSASKWTKERGALTAFTPPSQDSPGSPASLLRGKQTKLRPFLSPVTPVREQDSSAGDRRPLSIEKLSAVEHTPKTAERDVLKELFPNETLNTPTGMSATRRAPIRGAAGRPFSDAWRDELRPRLTELRQTTSSYTESRSISRSSATPVSSVPLSSVPLSSVPLTSIPKPSAPPSVQVKTRRRLPVWVQLLLLSAVAGFLFFVYQAMETNEISPFAQPESSGVVKGTSK